MVCLILGNAGTRLEGVGIKSGVDGMGMGEVGFWLCAPVLAG